MPHRDQVMSEHRLHAQMFGAEGDITHGEWHELLSRYGNVCLACGSTERLTPDHVVPLARGGENVIDNIQPLCLDCNRRKNAKTIDHREGRIVTHDVSVPDYIDTAFRSIKILLSTYRLLKVLAAQSGETLSALIDRMAHDEEQRRSPPRTDADDAST